MIELFLIGVFLFVVLAGCCWEVVFFRLVASSTDVFEEDLAGVGVIAFSVSSEISTNCFLEGVHIFVDRKYRSVLDAAKSIFFSETYSM